MRGTRHTFRFAAAAVVTAVIGTLGMFTAAVGSAELDADTCIATRDGATVTLTWLDEGGTHIVRRDGNWLATPGPDTNTYTDTNSPPGSTYLIRTRSLDPNPPDRPCTEQTPEPDPDPDPEPEPDPGPRRAERVIHVSIDGLRSDYVTPELMPHLSALIDDGASTLNARSDPNNTSTLPNHHSQFTGRPVLGPDGHQVDFNNDLGTSVHTEAGFYVASVFDQVHDRGASTVLLGGKSKFDMFDRNWSTEGADDPIEPDDGTDKIDLYDTTVAADALTLLIEELATDPDLEYAMWHIRDPDEVGHESGWASPAYEEAVVASDELLGQLVDVIAVDDDLATSTSLIVVSDHGGPTGGTTHDDPTDPETYTVPFVVWGPGVEPGADLYELNPERPDPGAARPGLEGAQPVRNHDVANLALDLLGYPAVPGSVFNASQTLHLE